MSLRLSEPSKWLTPHFRKLLINSKLVLMYLMDVCDWAGFLEVDEERISFDTDIPQVEIISVIESLSNDLVIVEGWVFILDFIALQQGLKMGKSLNSNNNAHKSILNKLNSHNHLIEKSLRIKENLAPFEGVLRGLVIVVVILLVEVMIIVVVMVLVKRFGTNSSNVISVIPQKINLANSRVNVIFLII